MAKATLAAVAVAVALLAGCTTTDGRVASLLRGETEAGVQLPDWPAACRAKEIHAALVKGEDLRVILQRERAALEKANKRLDTCAAYYDKLKALLGAGKVAK
jgi:outer membrane murein-binding lipoprotein Lpp